MQFAVKSRADNGEPTEWVCGLFEIHVSPTGPGTPLSYFLDIAWKGTTWKSIGYYPDLDAAIEAAANYCREYWRLDPMRWK